MVGGTISKEGDSELCKSSENEESNRMSILGHCFLILAMDAM